MTDLTRLKHDIVDHADRMGFDAQPRPTGVPHLDLVRSRAPTPLDVVDYRPIFCLVLQGAKQTVMGDTALTFSTGQTLIVGLDLPTTARIVTASGAAPYISLGLALDIALLRELMAELPDEALPPPRHEYRCSAMTVTRADPALMDAMARLYRLHEQPGDIPVLAPLLMREIHYRLLRSPEAPLLASLTRPDSHASRIATAIARIRRDFAEALPVGTLAREAGMSASAFHAHFRSLTGTTPLQYQKAVRLMEARRRLQDTDDSVSGIAFSVGYESPTQFSREYSRQFGRPPRADRALSGA
ncbi:MAG: AraC family transcriptional regulator [Pseudomonadota bacterium]|nr:AraC family transcriptional regulator [Pseudomonadota bacterium]